MSGLLKMLLSSVGEYIFSPQYQAMLDWAAVDPANRGIPPPLQTQKIQEDLYIRFLVSNGIWVTTDQLFFLNTYGDSKWSLINAVTPGTLNGSLIGNPTFSPGWGWLPSTNNALSTNFAPATHGVNYTQNIGGYIYFSGTEIPPTNGLEFAGASGASVQHGIGNSLRNASDTLTIRINEATAISYNNIKFSSGLYHVRRTASNALRVFSNGIDRGLATTASTGLTSQTITLGAFNSNGANVAWNSQYIGFWMIGNGWAGQEIDIWQAWQSLNERTIPVVNFPDWTVTDNDLADYMTSLNELNDSFTDTFGAIPVVNQVALAGASVTGYLGGVNVWDGTSYKIVFTPADAQFFLILDPRTDTYITSSTFLPAGTLKVISACVDPVSGWIYYAPYNATVVIKYNPVTQEVVYFDRSGVKPSMLGDLTGTHKWSHISVSSDGKIVCIPFDATEVMVIDPSDDSIYFLDTTGVVDFGDGNLTDPEKWDGGTAWGSWTFGAPSTATDYIKINTETNVVQRFGTIGAGSTKYAAMRLTRNPNLIAVFPYSSTTMLYLNPNTEGSTTAGTFNATGGIKVGGSFTLPDGRIFGTQGTDDFGILLNPDTPEAYQYGERINAVGTVGAVLAINGCGYSPPYTGTAILKTYFPSMNIQLDVNFIMSRYNNKA